MEPKTGSIRLKNPAEKSSARQDNASPASENKPIQTKALAKKVRAFNSGVRRIPHPEER